MPAVPSPPAPAQAGEEPAVACPGCGAVLAPTPGAEPAHQGAAACIRLFDETLRGLREDATADPAAAAAVRLADDAYAAQHPGPDDEALRTAVERLAARFGGEPAPDVDTGTAPTVWQTTIADVAADLDVVDLHVLVESWARAVLDDWVAAAGTRS